MKINDNEINVWKFVSTRDIAAPTISFNLDKNNQKSLKTVAF